MAMVLTTLKTPSRGRGKTRDEVTAFHTHRRPPSWRYSLCARGKKKNVDTHRANGGGFLVNSGLLECCEHGVL